MLNLRTLGIVLCAILVSPGTAAAAGAALAYPPDGALLDAGDLEVLGFRPASAPARLEVRGPGGQAAAYEVPAGLFRVAVGLSPGESTLTLGGAARRVFVTGGPAAPAGFSPPDLHAVDNDCGDCHAAGKEALALTEDPPALCAGCHDGIGTGAKGKPLAVPHPPVDEGDCLACHAFHGRAIGGLPAAERRELCFGCHDDMTDGGKLRMHGPVAKGECAGCHLVHGGEKAALLPATGLELCLRCHKDPSKDGEGGEWATPHPALDDGCETCHLPHAAASPGLLAQDQVALCGECHDGIVPEEGAGGVVHPPVADGECSACHNPHGSAAATLLRAEGAELCAECHDDPARNADGEEWATPHPALDDGCPTCHFPHASAQEALLRNRQAPLCFECHDTFPAMGTGGQALYVHAPVAQGRCAGCHNPHGSDAGKLLREESPGLCLRCHKDPAKTPEGGDWAEPHPALDDGCQACHRPHVAIARRLLDQPQAELCAGCHEDKNLDPDGEEWANPHRPVQSGECAACHGPHGSPEKALLRAPAVELCSRCHASPHPNHLAVELDAFGTPQTGSVVLPEDFPVRKKDGALVCTGCHAPHGSDAPQLWNVPEMEFCSRCHRQY